MIKISEALAGAELVLERLRAEQKEAVISICDQSGDLIYFARTDRARRSAIKISMNKAYTAARDEAETIEIGNMLRDKELGADIAFYGDPQFTGWGGGIPVRNASGIVIGAVGVSGMPEAEDIAFARLAVDAIEKQN